MSASSATALKPVSEPSPAPVDSESMLAIARLAAAVDVHIAPAFVDRFVRWQLDVRNFVHGVEDKLADLAEETGIVIPDLSILTTEPVQHTESSGFGWRDDPIRHTRSFHSGTDFRGDPGTPVLAAGDGVVVFCGRYYGYGNIIDVDHGGGVVTRYAHLRVIETTKDAVITAGQKIGQIGSTGRTTGPHLHFEIRLDGDAVDPVSAMSIAALQREMPIAGRLAALALSPELQANAESQVDPPKQKAHRTSDTETRPERKGRAKRRQILW